MFSSNKKNVEFADNKTIWQLQSFQANEDKFNPSMELKLTQEAWFTLLNKRTFIAEGAKANMQI